MGKNPLFHRQGKQVCIPGNFTSYYLTFAMFRVIAIRKLRSLAHSLDMYLSGAPSRIRSPTVMKTTCQHPALHLSATQQIPLLSQA